jgi:ABC-2 type transport system ATP-binding protein
VGTVIEVSELTKRYGGKAAVDHLSFTVRPGQVTGFLGPNGAGKSTTLRMILGLDAPTNGTATVNGVPFHRHPRGLRHVGALLDAGQIHGGRSAEAHLSALARSNGIPRNRVDEVLQEVGPGLAEAANRRIGGFSLGMKQRLGIATALLGDPPVLIFDEPINGMDPEGVRWSADINHAMVSAAWKRLVQNWEPDPGSLGYTATAPGSWIVYALWPLITIALALLVVRRRDV